MPILDIERFYPLRAVPTQRRGGAEDARKSAFLCGLHKRVRRSVRLQADRQLANQIKPRAQNAYTHAMATTPPTSVTPPYEIMAAFSGMRDSDVQTQK